MSIQSNINTGLSIVAFLMGQNSSLKEGLEKYRESKILKKEGAAQQELRKASKDISEIGSETEFEGQLALSKEEQKIAKKQFERDPTEEAFKRYETTLKRESELQAGLKDLKQTALKAETKAAERKRLAEIAAAEHQKMEQERMERSRKIISAITEGIPLSSSSRLYVEQLTGAEKYGKK